jgi:hypothetical protein
MCNTKCFHGDHQGWQLKRGELWNYPLITTSDLQDYLHKAVKTFAVSKVDASLFSPFSQTGANNIP